MPSSFQRALESGQPRTPWPPLTPWRAALKGSIHLWGLKAPLSPAGGGGGTAGGLASEGRNASGEVAPRAPVSRSPPDLHRDPFTTLSPFPHHLPEAFARLLRVGTAGRGGSLAPPLPLTPAKLFWDWELSSTSGPDGPRISPRCTRTRGCSGPALGARRLSFTPAKAQITPGLRAAPHMGGMDAEN